MNKYKPFINLGPGDAIRTELEALNWEQEDLASIMGRTPKNISELVRNKTSITYDTALLLSKIFKQSVQFWLNLDAAYRERLEAGAEVKETEARALIYRYMPVKALIKEGILSSKIASLKKEVCKFWRIARLDFSFLDSNKIKVHYRKSMAYENFNPSYALTWLQAVRNKAEERKVLKYNAKRFESLVSEIAKYSHMPNGIKSFINDIGSCGIIFVFMPHMPQTYTDGASFLLNGNPVMAYTGRYDREDNFWFTAAHEAGHILKHLQNKDDFFIDSLDNLDKTNKNEIEADLFAEKILKSKEILKAFENVMRPSENKIYVEAQRLGLSPAIITGCLQHHKKAAWTSFHDMKPKVKHLLKEF